MEVVGAFFDEEWELLSKMFSCGENPNLLFSSNGEIPSGNIPFDHHNLYCISEESSNASDHQVERALFPTHQEFLDHDHNVTNNSFEAMNFHSNMDMSNNDHGMMMMMMPVFSDDVMQEILYSKDEENDQPSETGDSCKEMEQLKRKSDQDCSPQISPKKIPRVSRKKNQSKKKKKMIEENDDEEERINDGSGINNIRQISSSSCSSEDDSNANSQELINGSLTSDSKAKSKTTRGSATDPQSLYARRRREKINERLKILQNLVPNGTKVDISTMLEEAVTYVKFLQLQIKLLSSDDLWMYAPLAYNGMDIGFYQNISPNLRA